MKDDAYYERRRRKIFEMYAAGHTLEEIGNHLGISRGRVGEIRRTHIARHGLTYPCPGHVVTVLTHTENGVLQETGQFVKEDEEKGYGTIYDPVDDRYYTGLILEILAHGTSDGHWQHPLIKELT